MAAASKGITRVCKSSTLRGLHFEVAALLMLHERLRHFCNISRAFRSAASLPNSSKFTSALHQLSRSITMARAPTRNPRALPQGGVERQQRKPSQRDSPHMDTELLLFLFAIVVDAVVVVAVVVVAVVFVVLPAPSTIPNYDLSLIHI